MRSMVKKHTTTTPTSNVSIVSAMRIVSAAFSNNSSTLFTGAHRLKSLTNIIFFFYKTDFINQIKNTNHNQLHHQIIWSFPIILLFPPFTPFAQLSHVLYHILPRYLLPALHAHDFNSFLSFFGLSPKLQTKKRLSLLVLNSIHFPAHQSPTTSAQIHTSFNKVMSIMTA